MNNGEQHVTVSFAKEPLYKRLIKRPFRSYTRVSGIAFGVVFVTNAVTSMFDGDRCDFAMAHPDIFSTALLTKSAFFGVLWPSFLITAWVSPPNAFILGTGVTDLAKRISE